MNYLFVGLYILCVKMKIFLCEESLYNYCAIKKKKLIPILPGSLLKGYGFNNLLLLQSQVLGTVLFCNYSIYKAIQLLFTCFLKNK